MSIKQFMARWKKGIQEVTPYQQTKIIYKNTWLVVVGISLGIYYSITQFEILYWLAIILIASLVNTLIAQLGTYQKLKMLEQFEKGVSE